MLVLLGFTAQKEFLQLNLIATMQLIALLADR
jgi:hypothetical protein